MKTLEAMQVIQLLERCERLGVAPAVLRDAAQLSPAQLADPDDRVPWDAFLRILGAAERDSGDPLIALRAGLAQPPRGILVYQFRAQQTLKDALAEFERNASLAADLLRFEVREDAREAWLRLGLDEPESAELRLVREYMAGFMVRFLADVLPGFRPRAVVFPHAPHGPLAECERLLGAPVRFRQRDCAIGFARSLLTAALPAANEVVVRVLGEQIDRRRTARSAGDFRASVEHAMERLLREDRSIGRAPVARRVGVSVRTLQRRLQAESCSFRAVREAVVRRAATALLELPTLSLSEVARRVGFADEDAFAKAWKRWTGRTPREQRRA
jgi:AraC-like DNA-binding protein